MYFDNTGMIIGMKAKEKKYKIIIKKLLNKEKLSEEDLKFLDKEKGLK